MCRTRIFCIFANLYPQNLKNMAKIKLQGEIDSWGYARYSLEYNLKQVPEDEPVILEVDSLGGDVMEAISISNILMERGNVTAHIVGFCASAATWLCYGCQKVILNDDCAFLVHKCSSYIDAWGMMNADELDALIEKLKSEKKSNEAIDLIIAQKYAKHSGGKLDVKGALKLMKEERWMLPEEALSLGLVDEISTEHVLAKSNYAARLHVINSMANMPKLPERFLDPSGEPENKGFVQKVKEALTEIFGGSVKMVADVQPIIPVDVKPEIKMNKEFVKVNEILNVEALEESEGKISFSVENVKAINDKLAELTTVMDTLKAEKQTAEDNLAAAETAINSISEEVACMDGMDAKVGVIKEALDKVTNVATETHAQNEGNGNEADVTLDPVNAYVEQFKK